MTVEDRADLGWSLVFIAIFVMALMPAVLDPSTVVGWWLGIGLLVAGGLVIVSAHNDNDGSES